MPSCQSCGVVACLCVHALYQHTMPDASNSCVPIDVSVTGVLGADSSENNSVKALRANSALHFFTGWGLLFSSFAKHIAVHATDIQVHC